MNLTFGDNTPTPHSFARSARILFRTEHLQLKWSHCSTTADFLSQYFAGVLRSERTAPQIIDVSHSIAYMANELVENAVKFRTTGDVAVEAGIEGGDFLLRITNWISEETSGKFQKLLSEITEGDPGDLLIERIEENAADGTSNASGLGLLTLMNDYGVKLTWNFEPAHDGTDRVHLETVARLHLPDPTPSNIAYRHHGN